MSHYPVRIRIGSAHAQENGVYQNADVAEAVDALRGSHVVHSDYSIHEGKTVHVVATYPETFTEKIRGKDYERKAGQPIFGFDGITVYPRNKSFGPKDCEINWSALGSSSPADTLLYAQMLQLAAMIADEANQVSCAECARH